MKTKYIIKSVSACMPASCWGRYGKIAVLEVEAGLTDVSMCSERATGVVRVVEIWDRLSMGKTDRCAYAVAMAEAQSLCDQLNEAA